MKQISGKNIVVTGKTPLFEIAPFLLPVLFVLKLVSDRAVLYENVAFSIIVLSTKKQNSGFLKRVCVFQKICFKVAVLKTFEISTDCHIKVWQSLKRRAFLKMPSTFF